MIASLPLALALSAVLVLTGCYALVRTTATMNGNLRSRRVAELGHLAMSVAMLGMTWTWAGPTGVIVQITLSAVLAGYFLLGAVQRHRTRPRSGTHDFAHALTAAAMVWMLAAMPLLMPTTAAASESGHDEHGSTVAMDMGTTAAAPAWAITVTVGTCAALLATSAFWTVRALHRRSASATGARSLLDPRINAHCHALMGLSMTAMLLAMINGW